MKTTHSNYQCAIKNYFSFLKHTTQLDELFNKSIPLKNNLGYLIPICKLHINDDELIKKFAAWREKYSAFFPTQFKVTEEGTTNWLEKGVLNVEDRILFLVVNPHGYPVGHLGFANCFNEDRVMEVDNVVRGIEDISPGIMRAAMEKIIDWAEEYIAPEGIILRVFSDNQHAIEFYEDLGFVSGELIPLKRYEENNNITFKTIENKESSADKHFLVMHYVTKSLSHAETLISTAGPSISAREITYAADAARNGWNNQWGKYINRFEHEFASYVGVKHALSTSSCTGALHIALAALGIGPGDEVIIPDLTWVATANAVVYVGATPVFADVDVKRWCIDPLSFTPLLTPRTKAVIPVHLYGHPAPIDEIVKIAREHQLYIIEDAAPAIGAEWKGQKIGTFGDFAAFSFQGAKLAVCGEGGILITNNDELYAKAYGIWDQGREPGTFWIKQNGLKYKMSNVQAAIGLGQIERVDELIHAKRRVFSWYTEYLHDLPGVQLNIETESAYSIYWMSSILLDEHAPLSRDELSIALKARNIDTRPVFPAISQYPHWPQRQSAQPNALYVGNNALNLPSGARLKKNQVEYICRTIKECFATNKISSAVSVY